MNDSLSDDQKRELVRRAVVEGAIPPVLYKYRTFDHRTDEIFDKHELWFSSPKDFNDPFDCKIQDDHSHSSADLADYLTKQGISNIDASTIILKDAKSGQLINDTIDDSKQTVINNRGVLCLSKRSDSILMWSHYASSHTGFVMGFEVDKDPLFFWNPLVVDYSERYPAFSYIKAQNEVVKKGIGIKAKAWEYEEEVRIIKQKSGGFTFDEKCLVEVIVGTVVDVKDEHRMAKLLSRNSYKHVTLKKAKVSSVAFSLELSIMSPGG